MKLSESIPYGSKFKTIFGLDLNDYLMAEFKVLGLAILDIIKLDNVLVERHSDYTDEMSMRECVIKHYGKEGCRLIEDFID